MFGRDNNRFEVNIRAERPSKLISLSEERKKREAKKTGKQPAKASFWQSSLGQLDLRTPWVLRLLAVVFILILSMMVL